MKHKKNKLQTTEIIAIQHLVIAIQSKRNWYFSPDFQSISKALYIIIEAFCLHAYFGHLFIFFPQNTDVCPLLYSYEQSSQRSIQLLCACKCNHFAYKERKKQPHNWGKCQLKYKEKKKKRRMCVNPHSVKNTQSLRFWPFSIKLLWKFSVLIFCWTHQRCSHLCKEGEMVSGSAGSKAKQQRLEQGW